MTSCKVLKLAVLVEKGFQVTVGWSEDRNTLSGFLFVSATSADYVHFLVGRCSIDYRAIFLHHSVNLKDKTLVSLEFLLE